MNLSTFSIPLFVTIICHSLLKSTAKFLHKFIPMEEEEEAQITHIALVSIPAFSHQVSILEFAKRLLHLHHFHVTCIIPAITGNSTASKPFFDSLPPTIHCVILPPINFDDLQDSSSISLETQLSLAVSRSMPYIREELKTLVSTISNNNKKNNLVALVADAMAHEALQFGKEFDVLSYIYFACSAMLLSLCLHSPRLDETVPCEYRDYPKPVEIPGCISVRGVDLPNSVQDRSSLAYKLYLRRCKQYLLADGILVNSFMGMEEGAFRALSQVEYPPVYAIGPIIQTACGPIHKTLTHTGKNSYISVIESVVQIVDPIHESLTDSDHNAIGPNIQAMGPITQIANPVHEVLTDNTKNLHVSSVDSVVQNDNLVQKTFTCSDKNPFLNEVEPNIQVVGPIHETLTCSDKKPHVYEIGSIVQMDGPIHETPIYCDLGKVDRCSLTRTRSRDKENTGWECLLWLDNQPANSVLYVSFGSGGTLSQEQINELALGLELSSHKFLWVNVKAPNDRATASYLTDDGVGPMDFLPKGFLERTKGRGLVMPSWAPQIEILGHNSVGGFLTHCGWNSVLESVVKGVPMIAWPLFAEQRTNAAMVTDGLKVAVRVKIGGNGIVSKEEIGNIIKGLMEGLEGEEIRRRMEDLKDVAACAVVEDGSSTKALLELASKWKSLGRSL